MGTYQQKRVFSIEKYMKSKPAIKVPKSPSLKPAVTDSSPVTPTASSQSPQQHQQIMEALLDIKGALDEMAETQPNDSTNGTQHPIANGDNTSAFPIGVTVEEMEEARKLRLELKEIYDAIEDTKKEILTIHQSGVNGMEISRVTDELGAIVAGTERATEGILASTEQIDQRAGDLVAALQDETLQGFASDIQDQAVGIFEACNFQDLTGQRITKVISAFRFIEERVIHMMEIWGGVDSFATIETEELEHRKGDRALLNGPALEDDEDIASQDDIDALFA